MSKQTPAPSSPIAGQPPLPPSVTVSRDRDNHVVYAIARGSRHGLVLVLAFFGVAVAAAFATVEAIRTRTVYDIGIALSFVSLALIMWAAFLSADRTRIRVVGGVLVVHTNDGDLRYELRDPQVVTAVTGDPRSKKWRLRVTGPGGRETVVRRSQADPEGLTSVIALYRRHVPAAEASVDAGRLPAPRAGADERARKRAV